MSVLSMFVCILILGAAATQQAPTDGGTQGDLCAQRGGLCQSINECDQTTNVFVGSCSEAIVCCVPKRFVCEKIRSGFCTSDITNCELKPGHQVSGLVCSVDSFCCVLPTPFFPRRDCDHDHHRLCSRHVGRGGHRDWGGHL